MKHFIVTFQVTGEFTETVSATSMEEAIKVARDFVELNMPNSRWPVQDVQVVKAEEIYTLNV